jgi:hypothetical protein
MRELRALDENRCLPPTALADKYDLMFQRASARRQADLVRVEITMSGDDVVTGDGVPPDARIHENMDAVVESPEQPQLDPGVTVLVTVARCGLDHGDALEPRIVQGFRSIERIMAMIARERGHVRWELSLDAGEVRAVCVEVDAALGDYMHRINIVVGLPPMFSCEARNKYERRE